MKLLFASDSFKGSLTSLEITAILTREARAAFPGCETVGVPVADGGEGTVDAMLAACGGTVRICAVSGPLGQPVQARYAVLPDGTAVVEMAQASGLALAGTVRDPLRASSRGTGEMMLHALQGGAKRLIVGIGGSATNDGGMGLLSALGARFIDADGQVCQGCGAEMQQVARAELAPAIERLEGVQLDVICDVTNPLLGENGATAVYGRQKGATPPVAARLERGMTRYAALLERTLGRDVSAFPGAGAAGGVGSALHGVLGARLRSGIDAVLEAADFESKLQGCDLVITGEGRLDRQSLAFGKVPVGVKRVCARHGVPVVALVGGLGEGGGDYCEAGVSAVFTVVDGVMDERAAMTNAAERYRAAAKRMFLLLQIGGMLKGEGTCGKS